MELNLLPILQTREENAPLLDLGADPQHLEMTVAFYHTVGFVKPWIGYLVQRKGEVVGSVAFKGAPKAGKVEIAYVTFEDYRRQGIATAACEKLVGLALDTDPKVQVTARTLPERNESSRILEKNGFICKGVVQDEEDGDVWEWLYLKTQGS